VLSAKSGRRWQKIGWCQLGKKKKKKCRTASCYMDAKCIARRRILLR